MFCLFVFWLDLYSNGASQVVLMVQKLPVNVGDGRHAVRSLGQKDPWKRA